MAEKLLIISDMWGVKKGLWITSYFGYLQQYYDITFYDCQQLANVDELINTEENLQKAYTDGGIDTAVAHLLKKETTASHVLAFGVGATIACKVALAGLPMKSLTALSATGIGEEKVCPNIDLNLIFGERDKLKPTIEWAKKVGVSLSLVPNFGHELYSDEKIISEVCMGLLNKATHKDIKVVRRKAS